MIYFNDLFLIQQFERDIRRYATHERKMMLDNHALYDKTKVGNAVSLRWATLILIPKSGSLNTFPELILVSRFSSLCPRCPVPTDHNWGQLERSWQEHDSHRAQNVPRRLWAQRCWASWVQASNEFELSLVYPWCLHCVTPKKTKDLPKSQMSLKYPSNAMRSRIPSGHMGH